MLRIIKQLFSSATEQREARPDTVTDLVADHPSQPLENGASSSYFDTMSRMQVAITRRDFDAAAVLVRENITHIPEWIKENLQQYGSFDIASIPSLEQGGKVLALVADKEGLLRMQAIVDSTPELEPWGENVKQHQYDLPLFIAIQEAVTSNPSCLQTDVKGLVGEENGRRVANLISYLEKAGKIVRTRHKSTYRLTTAELEDVPVTPPKRVVQSHRSETQPPEIREIDISSLSYVPLPRSPMRWEETQAGREREKIPQALDHFEVHDADWRIHSTEKIPLAERPDPAFRQIHPNDSGLLMIDDLGKAQGYGQIEAAALRYDRMGNMAVKSELQHGTYRVGVHPLGRGLIAMSRDCIVHAYDEYLEVILETALDTSPEMLALRRRFEIPDDNLKNHIRCVALSRAADLYAFTVVDEAWCIDVRGKGLWGVKLPFKDGWNRVATPSNNFGTSDEVEQALTLMGLSLPVEPDDIKRRFRELAKQYHPDLNPGDPQSQKRMKALNLAMEVLTGVELSTIPAYAGVTFIQELEIEQSEFEVGGIEFSATMTMTTSIGEIEASDWIYAASFAAESNSVYLAGYSGRVVLVDENGRGIRVYDIGSVPRRIVDTGDYLYLLTDTRLYVLRDDELHSLIDTFDGGDLVVAQTGFGLVEKKRLRWFREDGQYLGSVVTKDPIRRVYSSADGMIVETRQRRAVVHGVPTWWE